MQHLTEVDKRNLCNDYLNGSTIKELYTKYHIGDRRVRQILIDNNISIKNICYFAPVKGSFYYLFIYL